MVNPSEVQPSPADAVPSTRPPYRSALRTAQAASTRAAVLGAAQALFVEHGYLRTTMKQIAVAGGVSVETVYAQGSKQALLLACVDRALAGDDQPLAMTDRAPFTAALAAGSQREVVEGFVRALADVAVGAAGLVVAFEDAAAADAATAELWRQAERHRREDYRRLVEAVAARGPLRTGLDVETATDGVWLTATPRLAHQLAALGWSPDQVADWSARAVTALLLPPDDRTP